KFGLAEISAKTGFADQSHLTRWVRRVHGVSPTQIMAQESSRSALTIIPDRGHAMRKPWHLSESACAKSCPRCFRYGEIDTMATSEASFAARVRANQRELTSEIGTKFDYIVCGAGTSGSVVAARLAADPNIKVLLLEAGGSDETELIADPNR